MDNFSEASKDFDLNKLTPSQRRTYEASQRSGRSDFVPDEHTVHIMGADQIIAPYKIEIMFGKDRTVTGPNTYCLQAYESGKRFHGGGDELMYWCKDVREGHNDGCWAPIPGDRIFRGTAFCQGCSAQINADYLTGQRFGNVPTKALAEHVTKIWRQLGMAADIYCKYDRQDMRVEIMEKKVGAAKAHELRGLFIYPLKNILKDTSAGASVEGRFEAFFKA